MSGGAPSQPGAEPLHAARLLGAVATLEKPFDLEALLAIVKRPRFKAL